MLAENLVSTPGHCKSLNSSSPGEVLRIKYKEGEDIKGTAAENVGKATLIFLVALTHVEIVQVSYSAKLVESQSNAPDVDEDYDVESEGESVSHCELFSLVALSICFVRPATCHINSSSIWFSVLYLPGFIV